MGNFLTRWETFSQPVRTLLIVDGWLANSTVTCLNDRICRSLILHDVRLLPGSRRELRSTG